MSSLYSANQYDDAFIAHRLQNYQIPDQHKQRPSTRVGSTKIVANERGHLLSGVARSSVSPWGTFEGTWGRQTKPSKYLKSKKASDVVVAPINEPSVPDLPPVAEPAVEAGSPTSVAGPVPASPVAVPSPTRSVVASPKPASPVASVVPTEEKVLIAE